MTFFEPRPPVPDEDPTGRTGWIPPAWDRPSEGILPGTAPVSTLFARTDDVALALEQFEDPGVSMWMHRDGPRLGLEFSDGTRVSSEHFAPVPELAKDEQGMPVEPFLRPFGGGGSGHHYAMRFWCSPLPPAGQLTVYVEWSKVGIPETPALLEANSIREAAERSIVLWDASPGQRDQP